MIKYIMYKRLESRGGHTLTSQIIEVDFTDREHMVETWGPVTMQRWTGKMVDDKTRPKFKPREIKPLGFLDVFLLRKPAPAPAREVVGFHQQMERESILVQPIHIRGINLKIDGYLPVREKQRG